MQIVFRFKARDLDIGEDLAMSCVLSYSPSSTVSDYSSHFDNLDATFILGEFKAKDIASQAYDWFIGQHNVQIDKDSFEAFLMCIQSRTITPFISVYLIIEDDDV